MEKFMKKMWKKSEGFTLVELIVVIAILGILAAVAVPAYSGYITKANEAGDITSLDAVKTAAVAAMAEKGAVTKVAVDTDSTGAIVSVQATVSGTVYKLMDATPANEAAEAGDFDIYLGTASIKLKSDTFKNGAKWEGTDWVKE